MSLIKNLINKINPMASKKGKAEEKAAVAAKTNLPEHSEIMVTEYNGEKTVTYIYREQANDRNAFTISKKYADMTEEERATYDAFYNMVDSWE